jgi:hypothetical protein
MDDSTSFLCVDTGIWHTSDDAQVVFGRQHLDGNHGTTGIVGRCRRCGKGLPVITIEQPYEFRAGDQTWRIVLCWSAIQHIFVYRIDQGLPALLGLLAWSVNGYFDLSALRKVLIDLQSEHIVSQGEIDQVKQLLEATPAGDLWSRLVGA